MNEPLTPRAPRPGGLEDGSRADPTVLTTAALAREVAALKELLALQIDAESVARRAADDAGQATTLLQSDLRTEQLDSIHRELALIERQRVEQKKDTKDAVDAALAAAKEAVKEQTTASGLSIAKSETATNEQLKQLHITFTTAIDGVDRTMGDIKERVSRMENLQAGMADLGGRTLALERTQSGTAGVGRGRQESWAVLIAAVGGLAGVVGIVVALLAMFAK